MGWADHHPAHVHAIYAGSEALVRIDDGGVLRGDLPPVAHRLLREWMRAHRDELLANWRRAQALQPMLRPPRVVEVEHLGARRLRVRFSDGLVRELDFAGCLDSGVFALLEDDAAFARVAVEPAAGTLCWPNGLDLDPDVLHGDFEPASGRAPRVIREHRLRPTA